MGAILDDITACTDTIRRTQKPEMLVFFIIYVLLCSFTILNMLTGIMYDVVNATSEGEQLKRDELTLQETIEAVTKMMDKDMNNKISRDEYFSMKRKKKVMKSLQALGIDETTFDKFAELFFTPEREGEEEVQIDIEYMENCFMRLRPGQPVSHLDTTFIRQHLTKSHNLVLDRLDQIMDKLGISPPDPGGEPSTSALSNSQGKDPVNQGSANQAGCITATSVSQLEKTTNAVIIKELQRRLGVADLEKTGVPFHMMDDDLKNKVRAQHAVLTLGVPQPEDGEF